MGLQSDWRSKVALNKMELWQQGGVKCRSDAVRKPLVVVLMYKQPDGEGCGVRDAQAA